MTSQLQTDLLNLLSRLLQQHLDGVAARGREAANDHPEASAGDRSALGLFGLGSCARNQVRLRRAGAEPVPMPSEDEEEQERQGKVWKASLFGSALVYAIVIGVNFDLKIQGKHAEAWGPTPLGLPVVLVVCLVETILFLPVPWFCWHFMQLAFQAIKEGEHPGIFTVLRMGREYPHLRPSRNICLLGFLYFVSVVTVWIVYAAARGI